MNRSYRWISLSVLLATALSGCYVMPMARPAPVVVTSAPNGQVVYTQPAYPAPAVGYVWGWNPVASLFGWFHPSYGWYGHGHGHGHGYGYGGGHGHRR